MLIFGGVALFSCFVGPCFSYKFVNMCMLNVEMKCSWISTACEYIYIYLQINIVTRIIVNGKD